MMSVFGDESYQEAGTSTCCPETYAGGGGAGFNPMAFATRGQPM